MITQLQPELFQQFWCQLPGIGWIKSYPLFLQHGFLSAGQSLLDALGTKEAS